MAQTFGPDNARLTIRTARTGAASKAGHDLLIEVGSWQATLDPDAQPALTLTADSRSCRVLEGTGGVQGELELGGRRGPVAFELAVNDGQLTGQATVKQTAFGIKPYSALFGTLKVADDVRIEIDAKADQDSL